MIYLNFNFLNSTIFNYFFKNKNFLSLKINSKPIIFYYHIVYFFENLPYTSLHIFVFYVYLYMQIFAFQQYFYFKSPFL